MWPKYPLQFPEGDDNGGGGKTPEEIAAAEKEEANARFQAMEKAVGLIAQGHESLSGAITQLTSKIDTLGQAPQKTGGQGSQGEDEEVDLETLDRKGFAGHILKQVKGVMEEVIKPLGDRFGQLDEKIDGHSLSVMIKEFQKDHPDFFEWKDEMKGLLKSSPTLTPARAYTLARSESPDKAHKMNEKYKMGAPEKQSPNGQDFLSLFPQGGSATRSGNGKMNPKQAAEAAWDSVMSALGQ